MARHFKLGAVENYSALAKDTGTRFFKAEVRENDQSLMLSTLFYQIASLSAETPNNKRTIDKEALEFLATKNIYCAQEYQRLNKPTVQVAVATV